MPTPDETQPVLPAVEDIEENLETSSLDMTLVNLFPNLAAIIQQLHGLRKDLTTQSTPSPLTHKNNGEDAQ